jgi:two-component system response regulator AlgR
MPASWCRCGEPFADPMTEAAPLKLILVDDEPLARQRLRSLLLGAADPAVEIVGEAGDANAALTLLRGQPCDALLLDIRMPGKDGLQLAAAIRLLPHPPAVVFVTAHGSHALRAFELDAVDYLTKPVQRDRLKAALWRVQQRRAPVASGGAPLDESPVIVVNDRKRVLRVPVAEVLVLKAELKYVTLRTADRHHVLDDSLSDLEQRLAAMGGDFIRIHRNALVARHAVRELARRAEPDADEGWAVRVAPLDEWLPVSRRQLAAVRDALAQR